MMQFVKSSKFDKSFFNETNLLNREKTATFKKTVTVYHPHGSGYSLESCSPAELSSASPDETKFHKNILINKISYQLVNQKFPFLVNSIHDKSLA